MNAQKIPRPCGLKIWAITPYSLATAIAGGARIANPDLPDILLILEQPPFYTLSISQIFLNKKRRNLKKRETIDRYSFERRNQGRGEQKKWRNGQPKNYSMQT